jgi:hypothetical protein
MIGHRRVWSAVAVVGLFPAFVAAQQPDPGRAAAAKATSLSGTFSARQPGARTFQVLATNAELFTGDTLVTLPGAVLESKNGAVALTSYADYDGRGPLPILETAVVLADPNSADLAFTLDRGRVDLTNKKPAGPATVRVRFWDQTWTITLEEPGSRVAVELVGRWPAGTRFRAVDPKRPGTPPVPVASLVALVLKGSGQIGIGEFTLGLRAPPGPALLEWDSLAGARPEPRRLDKLPDWADPDVVTTPRGRQVAEAVEKFRVARATDADAAVRSFLGSADPVEQRVALVTCGALDDLEQLERELAGAKTLEEWDFGVTVVRHWLGRGPGQDQKLYVALVNDRGYDAPSARLVLQLLFGFSKEDLAQPETFDVLIEYLRHDRAAIRNLAAWHLIRLVPQGKSIPYKPDGTKADAEAAYKAWRKLIPPGQLPPTDSKKD